jgi:hypothetical protein
MAKRKEEKRQTIVYKTYTSIKYWATQHINFKLIEIH